MSDEQPDQYQPSVLTVRVAASIAYPNCTIVPYDDANVEYCVKVTHDNKWHVFNPYEMPLGVIANDYQALREGLEKNKGIQLEWTPSLQSDPSKDNSGYIINTEGYPDDVMDQLEQICDRDPIRAMYKAIDTLRAFCVIDDEQRSPPTPIDNAAKKIKQMYEELYEDAIHDRDAPLLITENEIARLLESSFDNDVPEREISVGGWNDDDERDGILIEELEDYGFNKCRRAFGIGKQY